LTSARRGTYRFRTAMKHLLSTLSGLALTLVLTVTVAAPSVVVAQAKGAAKSAPSAEAKEKARAAYGRGQSEFAAGRYAEAKAAFTEAFAAVPNPIVLLGVAESEGKLGEIAGAIATLQRYLELRTDAPDRADIEEKLKTLAATPARVAVTTQPAGAELEVDGFPTQKKTPAELELAPGDHELSYSLRGYRGGSEMLQLQPGERRDLALTLEALDVEPALAQAPAGVALPEEEASEEPGEEASSGRPTTALWITAGVGAAGLITGTVFGFLALSERSDFDEMPTKASADRGERLALVADVGFGVGIAALATAAILYLVTDDAPSDDSVALDGARLRF
jgi:tetratricopeptide (TPR) repeat protein